MDVDIASLSFNKTNYFCCSPQHSKLKNSDSQYFGYKAWTNKVWISNNFIFICTMYHISSSFCERSEKKSHRYMKWDVVFIFRPNNFKNYDDDDLFGCKFSFENPSGTNFPRLLPSSKPKPVSNSSRKSKKIFFPFCLRTDFSKKITNNPERRPCPFCPWKEILLYKNL